MGALIRLVVTLRLDCLNPKWPTNMALFGRPPTNVLLKFTPFVNIAK